MIDKSLILAEIIHKYMNYQMADSILNGEYYINRRDPLSREESFEESCKIKYEYKPIKKNELLPIEFIGIIHNFLLEHNITDDYINNNNKIEIFFMRYTKTGKSSTQYIYEYWPMIKINENLFLKIIFIGNYTDPITGMIHYLFPAYNHQGFKDEYNLKRVITKEPVIIEF
jgi:hypothetical protein